MVNEKYAKMFYKYYKYYDSPNVITNKQILVKENDLIFDHIDLFKNSPLSTDDEKIVVVNDYLWEYISARMIYLFKNNKEKINDKCQKLYELFMLEKINNDQYDLNI